MKITKAQLNSIIQEALAGVLGERISDDWNPWDDASGGGISWVYDEDYSDDDDIDMVDTEGHYGDIVGGAGSGGRVVRYEVPGGGMVPTKLKDDPNQQATLKIGDPNLHYGDQIGGASKMPRQTVAPMAEQLKQMVREELKNLLESKK